MSLSAFDYHSPADLAREHWDYEENARHDYLHEAFGAEARMLDEQAACDAKYDAECARVEEAASLGISVEELDERSMKAEVLRSEAAKCNRCRQLVFDAILPF